MGKKVKEKAEKKVTRRVAGEREGKRMRKEEKRRRKGGEKEETGTGKGMGKGKEGKGSGKGAEREKKGMQREGSEKCGKGVEGEGMTAIFFVYPSGTMLNLSCQIAWLPRHLFLVQWGCSHSWGLQLANGTG